MDLVIEYRKRAEECRRPARLANVTDHKKLLLTMADTGDILARQRETA